MSTIAKKGNIVSYKRDVYFRRFIRVFGEATYHEPVPQEAIDKYKGILPSLLLSYWRHEGWNGYSNGMLWIVNPDNYAGNLEKWLENTDLSKRDKYYVFARNSFGNLYVISAKTKQVFFIVPYLNAVFYTEKDLCAINTNQNDAIEHFFGFARRDKFDLDGDNGEPLFDKTLKRLGPCNENEMYTFVPPMLMGGTLAEKDLKKVNMFVQLDILANLSDERTLVAC